MTRRTPVGPTKSTLSQQDWIEIDGQIIHSGDRVSVLRPQGSSRERLMRGTYIFNALVTNEHGKSWVDIWGGRDSGNCEERKSRSFEIDRILPYSNLPYSKRRKRVGK